MKKIAIAVLLSTFVAAPAVAAEAYVGLSAGQNEMDFAGVDASTAFSVFAGYSFNEYVAGELAYTDFGKADTNFPGTTVKGNATNLSVVGSLPLANNFSLFAKLGYATTDIEPTGAASQTQDDMVYGVGAQYNASRNVGIRLGYDVYRVGETTTEDSGYTNIGVLYKF